MTNECDPIIEAGDDGEVLDETDEQACRNGTPNCAGPAAFDLSGEHYVPICAACRQEATCPGGNCD